MTDRSADEVKRLRLEARERAAVCADCFAPLAPMASITMKWRLVQHVPEQTFGAYASEQEHFAMVPICLHCWLVDLERSRRQDEATPRLSSIINEVRRLRCEGCRRPMRVEVRLFHRRLSRRERCCRKDCFRAAYRRANNLRRRRIPAAKTCAVCGSVFAPRKSNATTCSGKCRVKKMRIRELRQ
jgi:hypothetical protein